MVVPEIELTVKEIEEPEGKETLTVRGRTSAESTGLNVYTSAHSLVMDLKLENAPESYNFINTTRRKKNKEKRGEREETEKRKERKRKRESKVP